MAYGTNFNSTVKSYENLIPMDKPVNKRKLPSRLTHKHFNEMKLAARQNFTPDIDELVMEKGEKIPSFKCNLKAY